MSGEPQLFRIDPATRDVRGHERGRLHANWDSRNGVTSRSGWPITPASWVKDLLIIGKEFSGFDRTNARLDLLAVDTDGKLVVIELKRDDTGTDAHWQAIKYASYLRRVDADRIIGMLSPTTKHIRVGRSAQAGATHKLRRPQ